MERKERKKKLKESGKKGGNKTLENHGKEYFSEIGKKGADIRWNKNMVEEDMPEEDSPGDTEP